LNISSLYRGGSVAVAARELAVYELDLVGVQEVRWDKRSTVRAHVIWTGVYNQVW